VWTNRPSGHVHVGFEMSCRDLRAMAAHSLRGGHKHRKDPKRSHSGPFYRVKLQLLHRYDHEFGLTRAAAGHLQFLFALRFG